MARYTPRVAVGIEGHTPTVHVRRGAYPGAGLAGMYADGPDIWPSAYGEAVGTPSHSCSVGVWRRRNKELWRRLLCLQHWLQARQAYILASLDCLPAFAPRYVASGLLRKMQSVCLKKMRWIRMQLRLQELPRTLGLSSKNAYCSVYMCLGISP
jgi:hypothetical protein